MYTRFQLSIGRITVLMLIILYIKCLCCCLLLFVQKKENIFFIYISCVACFLKHFVISSFYFDRAGWNIFLTTASDDLSKLAQDTIQFWRNCNVITKLIICIFLFIIVLGTSVINKICFIIITSNIHVFMENDTSRQSLRTARGTIDFLGYTGDINKTNVLWIWSLVLIMGAPYVFIIGKCTWRLYGQMTRRKPVNLLTLLPVRLTSSEKFSLNNWLKAIYTLTASRHDLTSLFNRMSCFLQLTVTVLRLSLGNWLGF